MIEAVAPNVTVTNVETAVLNALSGDRTLNVTDWSGVKTYQAVGEGDITLVDVQTTDPVFEFLGTTGTNMTVSVNDTATDGLADELNVKLSDGVSGGTFTLTSDTDIETIRLTSSGAAENVITNIVGANVKTLIIEGDAAFENASAFASTISAIDARYVSTADIHSAGALTILTGAGDDLVTLDSALVNNSAIVMGAGSDTVHLVDSTGGAQAELIGMEFIKTLDGGATDIDMAKGTATPEFNIAGGSTSITLSNLINGTSVRTSELSTSGDINIGYRNGASDASLVVNLATQHNAADDAISFGNVANVTLTAQNGLYADGGGAAPTVTLDDTSLAGTVVSDVVKSLTVNNTGSATNGTDNIVLGNVSASSRLETLNLNATGAAVTVGTIAEAEALTSLNIDAAGGEAAVGDIGGTAASTRLSTIDVTAAENVALGAVAANNTNGVSNVTLAAAGGDIMGLVLTNDAGSIDAVNISGSGDVTATFNTVVLGTGTAGYTKAITSTNTGAVNLTVSNAKTSGAGTVVTLGDGSNTVTLLSSMNDVVTGGAGADTLFLTSGTNDVDLAAGTDTLSFDIAGAAEANGVIINAGSNDAFLNGATGATAGSTDIVGAFTAYSRSNDTGNIDDGGMVTSFTGVERFVGSDQADVLFSGSIGVRMDGAAGDDLFVGGSGADTFTGGEGLDTINSGSGDDTIILGSQANDGQDNIDGGAGIDTVTVATGAAFSFSTADSKLVNVQNVSMGAGASVTLTGQTEAFAITGGGGAETIISGSGDDIINGGLGNDFIQGAAGADVINGGAGLDTASYADVTGATSHGETAITGMAVNLSEESVADTTITSEFLDLTFAGPIMIANNDPDEVLTAGTVQYLSTVKGLTADDYSIDTVTSIEGFIGSALNDYIVLGADAVTVDAGAGGDIIFSGTAADNINAGSGDDFINIGSASDHSALETINGGTGDDVIQFTSVLGETLVLSANVTDIETVRVTNAGGVNTGTTAESIDASALTAGIALVGNNGDNTLTGSAFADTFVGGDGDDRLFVDDLDTAVDGGTGTDTIVVGANTTFGILAADGTTEQLENVEAASLASGVTLTVDFTDVLGASDIVTVTGVNDAATETFVVTGAAIGGSAILDFGGGAIDLTNVVLNYQGGAGTDFVIGAELTADILSGGLGNDTLYVALNGGEDTLTGGEGLDVFVVTAADSTRDIVVITDYEVGGATGAVDTIDVIDTNVATLSGIVTADTRTDLAPGAIVTREDGVTIESFEVSATGLVTLYDSNLAVGTIDEVYAESDADIYAIMEALTLLSGGATTYTFEYDFNQDGTADGQIVVSDSGPVTNIVQLVGVTGAEIDAVAGGIIVG